MTHTTHFTVVSIVSGQYHGDAAYGLESALELANAIRTRGFADSVYVLDPAGETVEEHSCATNKD